MLAMKPNLMVKNNTGDQKVMGDEIIDIKMRGARVAQMMLMNKKKVTKQGVSRQRYESSIDVDGVMELENLAHEASQVCVSGVYEKMQKDILDRAQTEVMKQMSSTMSQQAIPEKTDSNMVDDWDSN